MTAHYVIRTVTTNMTRHLQVYMYDTVEEEVLPPSA